MNGNRHCLRAFNHNMMTSLNGMALEYHYHNRIEKGPHRASEKSSKQVPQVCNNYTYHDRQFPLVMTLPHFTFFNIAMLSFLISQ